jgi:Lipase (class 3)
MVRRGCRRWPLLPFVVALLAALGCSGSDDGSDQASGALTWSKDLFAISNAPSGEFNAGDAYWMARISHLADGEVRGLLNNNYGALASVSELRVVATGTEVFELEVGDIVVVAYRGSETGTLESLTDWTTDFKVKKTPTLFGEIHAGILGAFLSVWNDSPTQPDGLRTRLLARLEHKRHPRVYFAGHSLGGALAELTYVYSQFEGCLKAYPGRTTPLPSGDDYYRCAKSDPEHMPIDVRTVYTFGAPRAGDDTFAGLVGGNSVRGSPPVLRVVNQNDIVPKIPLRIMGYAHPAREKDENSTLVQLMGQGQFRLHGPPVGTVGSVARHHMDDYEKELLQLQAHAPSQEVPDPRTYRKRLVETVWHDLREFATVAPSILQKDAQARFKSLSAKGPVEVSQFQLDGLTVFAVAVRSPDENGRHTTMTYLYEQDFTFLSLIVEIEHPSGDPERTTTFAIDEAPPL